MDYCRFKRVNRRVVSVHSGVETPHEEVCGGAGTEVGEPTMREYSPFVLSVSVGPSANLDAAVPQRKVASPPVPQFVAEKPAIGLAKSVSIWVDQSLISR